jgi:hypothetical protein
MWTLARFFFFLNLLIGNELLFACGKWDDVTYILQQKVLSNIKQYRSPNLDTHTPTSLTKP